MSSDSDGTPDSPEWRTALAQSLREGDEVYVNGRARPLTVTDRTTKEGSGGTYPHHHVWMEGNGTEYILKHYSVREYEPKLYSASEWEYKEQADGSEELWFKKHSGEDVLSLETAEQRVAIADVTAEQFIEPTVTETTWSQDFEPVESEPDGERLGECPDCGGEVVQEQKKASCRDCPLWCPVDEWRAYHVA